MINENTIKVLSREDLYCLIEGAIVLGCGGGGNPKIAQGIVDDLCRKGKKFQIVDPANLDDKDWVCILGYIGGGINEEETRLVEKLDRTWEHPIVHAANGLAQKLRVDFDAYLCSEIGAGNIFANFIVAAAEGKAVIDGDAIGKRAKPELSISLTNLLGLQATPLVAASHYGDLVTITKTRDDDRTEAICRYLARVSGGRIGVARCPALGSSIKSAICPGTLSLSIEIGRAIRGKVDCPASAIEKIIGGKALFVGNVETFTRDWREGFVYGEILLSGTNEYKGHSYKIWYKNENLISWRDGNVDVTCPDYLFAVDAVTGQGMYIWGDQYQPGKQVAVIGLEADAIWQTKPGLELFGPRHFGFDITYRPLSRNHVLNKV